MKTHLKLRGNLLVAVFALLSLSVSGARADYVLPDIKHAPFGDVNVVVPITSADPAIWSFRLHNIGNGTKVVSESGGTMKVKVVLYGAGIKMLIPPIDPKLKEAIDAARAAGAQFNVCNFSLKGMDLDWHNLYGVQESDIVPSGFAEVGWLGNHGWTVNAAN